MGDTTQELASHVSSPTLLNEILDLLTYLLILIALSKLKDFLKSQAVTITVA